MSSSETDGVLDGGDVLLTLSLRQLALVTEAVHGWRQAEEEDGDDPAALDELRDLDELLRGSHPRWSGQAQAFFEVRELPDEDHAHLLRTLFGEQEGRS